MFFHGVNFATVYVIGPASEPARAQQCFVLLSPDIDDRGHRDQRIIHVVSLIQLASANRFHPRPNAACGPHVGVAVNRFKYRMLLKLSASSQSPPLEAGLFLTQCLPCRTVPRPTPSRLRNLETLVNTGCGMRRFQRKRQ